jgi:hypothetical protein
VPQEEDSHASVAPVKTFLGLDGPAAAPAPPTSAPAPAARACGPHARAIAPAAPATEPA